MDKLIKNNILYVLIIILVIAGCGYLIYTQGTRAYNDYSEYTSKKDELSTKQQKVEQLKAQKAREKQEKAEAVSTKVIYEVSGQQFGPEASFGIMFDTMLANMTNNGIRIRSIDYNYSPSNDRVLEAGISGYNACELSFVTVGSYTQLQNFFRNLTKEDYLTSIYEVYLEPYDKDKTILVARFKIRLYTKTI